jgi:hypothetical protein
MSATAVLLFLVGVFVLVNAINLREVFKGNLKITPLGLDKSAQGTVSGSGKPGPVGSQTGGKPAPQG